MDQIREPDVPPPTALQWIWTIAVVAIGALLLYRIYVGVDSDYPAGRWPLYVWTCLAIVVVGPLYLLDHFLGRECASALRKTYGATLLAGGSWVLIAKADLERVLYEPLNPGTWSGLAQAQSPLYLWLALTSIIALGGWVAAIWAFMRIVSGGRDDVSG
jgi:hypothetical protein